MNWTFDLDQPAETVDSCLYLGRADVLGFNRFILRGTYVEDRVASVPLSVAARIISDPRVAALCGTQVREACGPSRLHANTRAARLDNCPFFEQSCSAVLT